jgi:hypothetical protein
VGAALRTDVRREADRGLHRLILHLDLREFWFTNFTPNWKVRGWEVRHDRGVI